MIPSYFVVLLTLAFALGTRKALAAGSRSQGLQQAGKSLLHSSA
jgi:hypothetical protein